MLVLWPGWVVQYGPSSYAKDNTDRSEGLSSENVLKVGVLASGTGSLLQSILDGSKDRYEVVVVISDRPGVKALERAEASGIPGLVIDFAAVGDRDLFSEQVAKMLLEYGVELVAQAGFMRILTAPYFDLLAPRPILNSHPALLPSFPGAHGVREALAAGVKVTGTTIHLVTLEVDAGPILAQESVVVQPADTENSLHERIKVVEQRLYPEVIATFA